jgi:hypothetical protein
MKILLTLLIVLSSLALPSVCRADTDAYQITNGDKTFYEQIKKAILANDFDSFAAAVSYPIELYFAGERRLQPKSARIRTKAELKKYKSAILGEPLKNAVRNQSSNSLFKNWQGIMVGNGELWFDQVRPDGQTNFTYKITAINITIQR